MLKIKAGMDNFFLKLRATLTFWAPEGWHEAGFVLWKHKSYKFSRPGFVYPWINVLWDVTLGC